MTIKKPPSTLPPPSYFTIAKDTSLHRVHKTKYQFNEFNDGNGAISRFAHFSNPSGITISSLYAAATMQSAIHETIFHDIPANQRSKTVPKRNIYELTHSVLKNNRKLKLVELRNATLGRWGISRRDLIETSPKLYNETVLWAEAIYNNFPDAEGLVWTSRQSDPDDTYLFFGDRVSEGDFTRTSFRDGASDKSFLSDVTAEGDARGITITI